MTNPASTTITRDNGNGSVTERTYSSVSDRKLAERTEHQEHKPSLSVQERTVEK